MELLKEIGVDADDIMTKCPPFVGLEGELSEQEPMKGGGGAPHIVPHTHHLCYHTSSHHTPSHHHTTPHHTTHHTTLSIS